MEGGPGLHNVLLWAAAGWQPDGGTEQSLCLSADKDPISATAGPKAVQNACLFRGAPTLKGVGSAAYPCPLSDRSAPLRVLKALNGGFEQSPGLYCFPCGSAGKESACSAGDLDSIPGLGKIPWRRGRLPTPVFWRGEFHGLL